MTDAVSVPQLGAQLLEQVLIGGDLSKLTPTERMMYYQKTCESLGLNPLTKPFEYITLNGKVTLYAKRDCTEQLRKINGVSIIILSREIIEDCYVVTARATDKTGRHDESIGAVPIGALRGEARSNAMMKAETKAKRRVTLSICGMGMLDESEADSIPGAYPSPDGKIAPTAGVLGSLAIQRQEIISETAAQIRGFLVNNQAWDAYSLIEGSGFDADERVALTSMLDSKQRGVLSRMRDAELVKEAGTISVPQHKRLEARIKELELDRERVKSHCFMTYGISHFTDLNPEQYKALDAELENFAAGGTKTAAPHVQSHPEGSATADDTVGLAAAAATITPDQAMDLERWATALKAVRKFKLKFDVEMFSQVPASKHTEAQSWLKSVEDYLRTQG